MVDDYTDFDEEPKKAITKEYTDGIDIMDYEERNKKASDGLIHKNMMISEAANNYPEIVPILMENGLHCVGCAISEFETLEEGFFGHGMDSSGVDKLIDELNEYIKNNSRKE